MFRARAHSLTQQARLAISLSWVAGYTNALTVLTCGQVTSHLTGSVSQIGVEAAHLRWTHAGYLTGLVAAFLVGAFAAGVLTELGRLRRLQSIYVLPMLVEAVLLGLFALLVDWRATGGLQPGDAQVWLTFVPALAMGLQNATITRISGGVVRTTHVTGVVTDLGLELSAVLFRSAGLSRPLDAQRAFHTRWRILLLLSIPGSFALGAGLGTLGFDHFDAASMTPAVAFLAFLTLQGILVPIAAIELRPGPLDAAARLAIFRAEPPADAKRMRLPDLTAWASNLDHSVRTVILDLAGLPEFGERSAHELRSLLLHLREEGRSLILAGLSTLHTTSLQHAGVLRDFDANDLCGDLQAALLRADQVRRAE